MATTTKKPTIKKAPKAATSKDAVKKPAKAKKETAEHTETVHAEKPVEHKAAIIEKHVEAKPEAFAGAELTLKDGRYVYAVGRRKTSVANVRLFSGKGKSTVNKKDLSVYFGNNSLFLERIFKPLQLVGLENKTFMYVNTNGGGLHSQAQALSHGIAMALVKHSEEYRKVLKKNGCLTRDSRKKERKKPGLKRARRGPQWAKR